MPWLNIAKQEIAAMTSLSALVDKNNQIMNIQVSPSSERGSARRVMKQPLCHMEQTMKAENSPAHAPHIPEDSGLVLISDVGLDEYEQKILQIARLVFATFDKPETQRWVQAFHIAENSFPAPFGATIAHAVVITLNALRV